MTFRNALAVALALGALTLAACSTEAPEGDAAHGGSGRQHASSSAGLPAGRAEAGARIAADKERSPTKQSCIDCHGPAGNAPIDAAYPRLGGQYADYLAHSLQAYRAGDRQHALMSSQAENLSDQQIADLSAYFAAQQATVADLSSVALQ